MVSIRFDVIIIKVFYLYWVKVFVLLVLFHWLWLIILLDHMDWSAISHWFSVHLLSPYYSPHHLEVVGLSTFSAFFAVWRILSQQVTCPSVFAIIHSFLFSKDLIVMFLCAVPHSSEIFGLLFWLVLLSIPSAPPFFGPITILSFL